MRRKKLKPWEEFARVRRERDWSSLKLSELYADVQELRAELHFTPHDPPSTPLNSSEAWNPDDRAFFEIQCPDRECICGGFDLSGAIGQAVKDHRTSVQGRLGCDGWQDTERYRKHRCMMSLDYRLLLTYRSTLGAANR